MTGARSPTESNRSRPAIQVWLVIACSLLWFAWRVLHVRSEKGDLPFQSANDRSRWCTVSALVDQGTFAIDDVIERPGWNTIDKVRHLDEKGVARYYSSKPPLLATMLAGMYWPLRQCLGWTLESRPFAVVRTIVLLFNGAMLGLLFLGIHLCAERYGRTSWSKLFVLSVAAWGTHLTSFAVTINNHLPAAAGVALALGLTCRNLDPPRVSAWSHFACGVAAAWGFANELPALGFLAAVIGIYLLASPRAAVRFLLPGVLCVLAAWEFTTWWAHGSLTPPYFHRAAGENFQSDNWYVFPKSYWLPENRGGIDVGEPRRMTYLCHLTIGHHGVLSLTPVWLLTIAGLWRWRRRPGGMGVFWLVVGLTLACLVFFVLRPLEDRNYSGRASAFRWMLWLIPLWLWGMIPAADEWSRRASGRWIAWLLLLASVASAAYGWQRPWRHPWLYPEEPPRSSSSKTAFINKGQTTVASAYTSACRPPSAGETNFPQLTPSE